RPSPIEETYATLYDSPAWTEHENVVTSAVPLDVWREGCWRFVVFPARVDGQEREVVFAVSTAERDRSVRSALVDPEKSLSADLGRARSRRRTRRCTTARRGRSTRTSSRARCRWTCGGRAAGVSWSSRRGWTVRRGRSCSRCRPLSATEA